MAKTPTSIVPVRLPVEIATWLQKESDARKVIESLYDLVQSGRLYCSGKDLIISKLYRVEGRPPIDYDKRYDAMEKRFVIERETRQEISKRLDVLEGEWQAALGGVSYGTLKALEDAAIDRGTTIGALVTDLCEKIIDGRIVINGGIEVQTVNACPFDYESFVSACDAMNRSYDYTIEKVAKMIYGGEI